MVLAAAGLSLSDRVPLELEHLASALRIDDALREGVFGQSPYTLGHFALWSVVTWLIAVAVGRIHLLAPIAGVAFAASVLIEGLQVVATSSRAFEAGDVAANCVGALLGAALAWPVIVWFAHQRSPLRPPA